MATYLSHIRIYKTWNYVYHYSLLARKGNCLKQNNSHFSVSFLMFIIYWKHCSFCLNDAAIPRTNFKTCVVCKMLNKTRKSVIEIQIKRYVLDSREHKKDVIDRRSHRMFPFLAQSSILTFSIMNFYIS